MNAREIIMNHYMNPLNRQIKDLAGYIKVNSNNESCVDNIDLYVKFNKEIIEDITFMGEACAIAIASTSIMIKNLRGKKLDYALKYIEEFYQMTDGAKYDREMLKEATAFEEISQLGHRKTCVQLPLKGLRKAIIKYPLEGVKTDE